MTSSNHVNLPLVQMSVLDSDVPGLAWPESPGLGLALEGSGLAKPQARPRPSEWAWPGLGLGLGQGLWLKMRK
jgi:hypothetical protein